MRDYLSALAVRASQPSRSVRPALPPVASGRLTPVNSDHAFAGSQTTRMDLAAHGDAVPGDEDHEAHEFILQFDVSSDNSADIPSHKPAAAQTARPLQRRAMAQPTQQRDEAQQTSAFELDEHSFTANQRHTPTVDSTSIAPQRRFRNHKESDVKIVDEQPTKDVDLESPPRAVEQRADRRVAGPIVRRTSRQSDDAAGDNGKHVVQSQLHMVRNQSAQNVATPLADRQPTTRSDADLHSIQPRARRVVNEATDIIPLAAAQSVTAVRTQPPSESRPHETSPETIVNVTIGRVEVRATVPQKPTSRPTQKTPAATQGLEHYLSGGRSS